MVRLLVFLLGLFCALESSIFGHGGFTVFAPDQDAAALAALSETLSSGEPGTVNVAKTVEEALKSSAEVLVFVMERDTTYSPGAEAIEELKKKKIIGVGYGAAMVFKSLGLEIQSGACAHDSGDLRPEIEIQSNPLNPEMPSSVIAAYELKQKLEERVMLNYNFAMHLPAKDPLIQFVDPLARRKGDKNYAPIVRQGNYIMVGVAAPATVWTPEYKTFFSAMANRFAKAPRVAFAQATWELTQPGSYQFDLANNRNTTELSSKSFRFRFDKPVRFSAVIDHKGSSSVMLLFSGPDGERWTREDAKSGEPLRIQVDISGDDVKKVGQNFWLLQVTNFDDGNRAKCRVNIEYPPLP